MESDPKDIKSLRREVMQLEAEKLLFETEILKEVQEKIKLEKELLKQENKVLLLEKEKLELENKKAKKLLNNKQNGST